MTADWPDIRPSRIVREASHYLGKYFPKREEFLKLLGADSKGRYFNPRIRDRFRYRLLGL